MFRPLRRLVIPAPIRTGIATAVATAHPDEAGGYLACERDGDTLRATEHVPLDNEAEEPRRRFVSTDRGSVPARPRVFYHSHTTAAAPSELTGIDRQGIPDPLALVVFAPHGQPYSYRLFRRGLFNWRELPVEADTAGEGQNLPRLV